MMWINIAMIVFAVTEANHMGLIDAVEKATGFKLPIVNCCKCGSFWATLAYCIIKHAGNGIIAIVAISFLAALCAVWLELLMGLLDILYNKAYERIFNETTVSTTDGNKDDTETINESGATAALP